MANEWCSNLYVEPPSWLRGLETQFMEFVTAEVEDLKGAMLKKLERLYAVVDVLQHNLKNTQDVYNEMAEAVEEIQMESCARQDVTENMKHEGANLVLPGPG